MQDFAHLAPSIGTDRTLFSSSSSFRISFIRVWSTFSRANFNEDELETLVQDTDSLLTERYGEEDPFVLDEEYVIITGVKN